MSDYVLLTMAPTGLIGILLEIIVFHPILRRESPRLYLTVSTLGIAMALQVIAITVWGAES